VSHLPTDAQTNGSVWRSIYYRRRQTDSTTASPRKLPLCKENFIVTSPLNSIKRIFRNANKVLKAECHYHGGHIAYVPLTPDEERTMDRLFPSLQSSPLLTEAQQAEFDALKRDVLYRGARFVRKELDRTVKTELLPGSPKSERNRA